MPITFYILLASSLLTILTGKELIALPPKYVLLYLCTSDICTVHSESGRRNEHLIRTFKNYIQEAAIALRFDLLGSEAG